jgi:hypothetical protein
MADRPTDKLESAVTKPYRTARSAVEGMQNLDPLPILEALQRMIMGEHRVPRIDEPLPRIDPATGQVIEPPGGPMGRKNGIFGPK